MSSDASISILCPFILTDFVVNCSYKIGNEEDLLRISTFLLNGNCNSIVVAYTNGLLRNYRLPLLENGSEVVNPEIIRQWKSTHSAPVLVMKFSRGDALLATGSADFVVKVWILNYVIV